jgi:oligoribonuclease NrnB/cAMP/cGMP phosphodiesterase (DHH superfamily)
MTQSHIAILTHINKDSKTVTQKNTVVFGHHPCPDGIASLVCLEEKLGRDQTSYHGLNHASLEEMRKNIFSAIDSQITHIIFADIIPPFILLKELLEKTTCKITLLDHHATAKAEMDASAAFLKSFVDSKRLHIDLDMKRSGAGIAYDYANGKKERPLSIDLVQAIDLLTATADHEVIKSFDAKKLNLDNNAKSLLTSLGLLSQNNLIKDNIEFYVFAAVFDLQMKKFFAEQKQILNLMDTTKDYFTQIEKNGLASLLKAKLPDNSTIEAAFTKQLAYQKTAIANAKIIPSLINNGMDVLFIEADIQTGRTFDALIAEKLATFTRPTIAMVANTKTISDRNNWVALRAASNQYNLFEIASAYKTKKLALNAGGHPRASALQLDRNQLITFMDLIPKPLTAPNLTIQHK